MGANGALLSMRRVAEACVEYKQPFVCGVYIAPILSIAPHWPWFDYLA